MLDKSLPYRNIVMRIPGEAVPFIGEPALPAGYSFRLFQEGDEAAWAAVEASVGEFETEAAARDYFCREYLPYLEELKRRCVFVCAPGGRAVGTATAWFAKSELGYQASLHWVAVQPEEQGRGLGSAVVRRAMRLFLSTDPGEAVWLHTQTWSHKAVGMYRSMGFRMLRTGRIALMSNEPEGTVVPPNDFAQALTVLKTISPELSAALEAEAE